MKIRDDVQPALETKTLLLRPFSIDDCARVTELLGDSRVSCTTLSIPNPYTTDMAESWISDHEKTWRERSKIAFAICLKKPEQVVGAITLMDAKCEKASLGYWIEHDHWGQGYCTQALEAMLRFAFEDLELPRVNAEHLQSNPALAT